MPSTARLLTELVLARHGRPVHRRDAPRWLPQDVPPGAVTARRAGRSGRRAD